MRQDSISWRACGLFGLVHVGAVVGVVACGVTASHVGLALLLYAIRMFAITGGTHRYFSHRSYETSRAFQLVLATIATMSSQMGVMWWAAHHRIHHRHADQPRDPHQRARGFWWAHMGWFLVDTHDATEWAQLPDFADNRELRWLDRYHFEPAIALIAILGLVGGLSAIAWGYCVSTVLLWHATFSLTSVSHWLGTRRYATRDESCNNAVVALLTFGDGWHNNHHREPGSARHGHAWWELDITYSVLCVLAAFGIVWNLRGVRSYVLEAA
jgi:stearoyl-CoA desaturase (delta-9 desaturase)